MTIFVHTPDIQEHLPVLIGVKFCDKA